MNKCLHDNVKFLTKHHGDVWICMNCKKSSKPEVFTKEEIESLVEFNLALREKRRKEKNEADNSNRR